MTSRSLFFKLMKEDLKRKLWAVGLAFLSFFFWMPVSAAMGISQLKQNLEQWIQMGTVFENGTVTAQQRYQSLLLNLVPDILGFRNVLVAMTVGGAAIVLAITGFMYLHSRKQVDFYHSIPVRREVLFAVKYIDGFLIVLSMYLLNLILAVCVFAANGVGLSVTAVPALTAMAVHMVGFLLNYGLMTIAVILTGNFFVSILGGFVLFAYIPAVLSLVQGLMYLFFVTVNMRNFPISQWMIHSSPIAYYTWLVGLGAGEKLTDYGSLMGNAGAALLAAVLMAAAAMVLYKKRPSESSGKAMAFRITKAPIKILIVSPVTICAAVLFWNAYYSIPWSVFGFVLGLVITHGIIEIIYHFDFRKLFANPAHMGICAVLALAVIGVFRFDLVGYDTYLPKESQFESASIYGYGLRDWIDYGLPVKSADGSGYQWSYMDGANYAASNMAVTDYSVISAIAGSGIETAEKSRENRIFNRWDSGYDEDGYWVSLEVGYRLKNRKQVFRTYSVNLSSVRDEFDRMYEAAEYKSGVYPVLSYQEDSLNGVYETNGTGIERVDMDPEMIKELLSAYKEELTALTFEERADTTPVTSLRFLTIAEYDYLKQVTASRTPNFVGDFSLNDMSEVNFFPVYPSFTKTLGLLREAGSRTAEATAPADVDRIEIYYGYSGTRPDSYGESAVKAAESEITQTFVQVEYSQAMGQSVYVIENDGSPEALEKIKEILDASANSSMARLNGLQFMDYSFDIRVYLKKTQPDSRVDEQYEGRAFKGGQVPEALRMISGYDEEDAGWKSISYGLNGQN